MSKLLFLIGKIFSWFILLSSRSNSFLEQATNLFLLDPASVNPETENSDFQFSLVDLSNFKAISHIFYCNLLPSDPSITKQSSSVSCSCWRPWAMRAGCDGVAIVSKIPVRE